MVRKIGSNKDEAVDVRIIAATNEDLSDAAKRGDFREDLYHRLNEFNLDIAPIRDKKEDILMFATHFLKLANRDLGKTVKGLNKDVEKIFLKYPWYGNLRELKNVVKRSVLLCTSDFISKEHLPHEIVYYNYDSFDEAEDPNAATDLKSTAEMAEKKAIIKALNETDYNKTKAAKLLNIDRKTLYNKLNEYKIDL